MSATDIVRVHDDIVARLGANPPRDADGNAMPLRWPDDNGALPDEPAPFVYFDLVTDRGQIISFGGGRAKNMQRNFGELNCYVFVPRGYGIREALRLAESVATIFRGWRSSGGLSCIEASVHPIGEGEQLVPPGLSTVAGNYACAVAAVDFFFDQLN